MKVFKTQPSEFENENFVKNLYQMAIKYIPKD